MDTADKKPAPLNVSIDQRTPFTLQRTPFCRLLSMAAKIFPFTLQRTFLSQNAGIKMRNFQKICAPAFAKAGARCICGYEIWESSKHIRCPYTPEKGAVQPCARTAPFAVGEAPTP